MTTSISKLTTAALAAAALLAGAGTAQAQDPWPNDHRDAFNSRNGASAGPAGSRGVNLSKLWERRFDSPVLGTPVIGKEGGTYVATEAGTVYGLLRDTGTVFWARFTGGELRGGVLKFGETIYAVAHTRGGAKLVALDALNGQLKFETPLDSRADVDACGAPNVAPTPNLVIVGLGACKAERENRATTVDGAIAAVDATTGELKWKTSMAPGSSNGAGVSSTPAVYDEGNLGWATTGHAATGTPGSLADSIVQFDTRTGEVLKRFQAHADDRSQNAATDINNRRGFTAPAIPYAVRGNGAFVAAPAEDGTHYFADAFSMEERGRVLVSPGQGPAGITAASALDSKGVVGATRTPTAFYGIDPLGKQLLFAFPSLEAEHTGPVSISDNALWSTSRAGTLDVHWRTDGRLLGRFPLGQASVGGVSHFRNRAYAAVGVPGGTSGAVVVVQ